MTEGPANFQDPGLDEETRSRAIKAVREELGRSVFVIDRDLRAAEQQMRLASHEMGPGYKYSPGWLQRCEDGIRKYSEELLAR